MQVWNGAQLRSQHFSGATTLELPRIWLQIGYLSIELQRTFFVSCHLFNVIFRFTLCLKTISACMHLPLLSNFFDIFAMTHYWFVHVITQPGYGPLEPLLRPARLSTQVVLQKTTEKSCEIANGTKRPLHLFWTQKFENLCMRLQKVLA